MLLRAESFPDQSLPEVADDRFTRFFGNGNPNSRWGIWIGLDCTHQEKVIRFVFSST